MAKTQTHNIVFKEQTKSIRTTKLSETLKQWTGMEETSGTYRKYPYLLWGQLRWM